MKMLILLLVCVWGVVWACQSDLECGLGKHCVKAYMQSKGECMKTVDEVGTPQYSPPRGDSLLPNYDSDGDCRYDSDCPYGFRCHSIYKTCVK
ncbi:hypothetical protein CCY99_04840 [Helicobacter sp. 16-1353]|uniref:hypothetical protein n=1 Tax=Helicobacter sp. 16-1353 TaxID=2004996 RepID=UPI000DCD92DB|nr:hypothetical protein [Helicobacter sp. 16-1353]RAX54013.1 hypothetical protein CCY99_04840 [Helicobacter sp. 16-1353]